MELLRYLICGGVSTIVSFVSYFGLTLFMGKSNAWTLQVANIGSWFCGVLVAFLISRFWVFHPARTGITGIKKEIISFFSGRLFTLGVDMILMQILVFEFLFSQFLAKIIVQIVVTILNYILSKYTFRRSHGQNSSIDSLLQ